MPFGNGQKKPFEHKPNTGSLFKNLKKDKETSPDYTGSCNIEGEMFRIAAWLNDGNKGKYFKFKFSRPQEDQRTPRGMRDDQSQRAVPRRDDEDIPF